MRVDLLRHILTLLSGNLARNLFALLTIATIITIANTMMMTVMIVNMMMTAMIMFPAILKNDN